MIGYSREWFWTSLSVVAVFVIQLPPSGLAKNILVTSIPLELFFIYSFFFKWAQVMGEEAAPLPVRYGSNESLPANAPAPMTDIHDILPPIPVGINAPWLIPVLIALGAVALLALAWWLWKKYKKDRTIETIVPELPPEMTAMQCPG
jgi:hypothetical protein